MHGLIAFLHAGLRRVVEHVRTLRTERRGLWSLRSMQEMNDHMLRDIGLSRDGLRRMEHDMAAGGVPGEKRRSPASLQYAGVSECCSGPACRRDAGWGVASPNAVRHVSGTCCGLSGRCC